MQTVNVDIAIVGAGGGGLRAAIAAAESKQELDELKVELNRPFWFIT